MENIGILFGILFGLLGFIFSIIQFFYQRHKDKAQLKREAAKEKEQAAKEKERDEREDLKDRLAFLMQVIIDKDIPRESRQPFYDEYIAKGGNGTVIKFWLENRDAK